MEGDVSVVVAEVEARHCEGSPLFCDMCLSCSRMEEKSVVVVCLDGDVS